MPGTLFVVATPIGNLEDVTLRALRVLREVAVIAAEDTRRTAHLLARHAIPTPTTSLHEHNEGTKSTALVQRLLNGEDVAIVSDAGTPTVSDPGAVLVREATAAGIRVVPIPGPSAAMAALTISGLPADRFTFLGFPPIRAKDRKIWFDRLRSASGTVVFFEAPHRIQTTLEELRENTGDCRVVICRELTKIHEELVRGPISDVLQALPEPRGEFTIVVEVGDLPDISPIQQPAADTLMREFGELTANKATSRRKAIAQIAKRHRMAANEVYAILELAKKSG